MSVLLNFWNFSIQESYFTEGRPHCSPYRLTATLPGKNHSTDSEINSWNSIKLSKCSLERFLQTLPLKPSEGFKKESGQVLCFTKPGAGGGRGQKHKTYFLDVLKIVKKDIKITKKHDCRCVLEGEKINLGRGDRKGFGRGRNLSTLSLEHFPIAGCSLKQMTRRLFIHQVESSSDEFPSCANCDRNEKTPMFFCNTCGQFFLDKYLTKTTPKFASSPAKTQKSKSIVSSRVVLWCVPWYFSPPASSTDLSLQAPSG